ncbi:MAG: universal stress protein [Sterolibacterium sp.]|jgi:hypothetical protein
MSSQVSQLSPIGRFEKILLATDGSEFSAGAARAAIHLARACGGKLTAMSMVLGNPEYDTLAPKLVAKALAEARMTLEQVKVEAKAAGIECATQLRQGEDPHKEIVAASEELQADVVVMGRRGRRGLARLMVGDATAKVVGNAHCSVLVVPRDADLGTARILLATDGSRYADAAAVTASGLARHLGLPVSVISVKVPSHSDSRRAEAETIVSRVVEFLGKEGIAVDGRTGEGEVADVVAAAARATGADIIVISSYGRTGWGRALLGSNGERIIGKAECAVLVAKGA